MIAGVRPESMTTIGCSGELCVKVISLTTKSREPVIRGLCNPTAPIRVIPESALQYSHKQQCTVVITYV